VTPNSGSSDTHHKPHVLLVEDEPLVIALMQEVLTDAGFIVCLATNGGAAVNHLIRGEIVDVIFTDIHMPGINGAQLAKLARDLRPDIQIVYTSGGVLDDSEKVPGSTFVQKPYEPSKVCALLAKVAGRA
jgi:CheY-like chemotaxis protein